MSLSTQSKLLLSSPFITTFGRLFALFVQPIWFAIAFYAIAFVAIAYAGWESKEETDSAGFGWLVFGLGLLINAIPFFAI